MGRIRDLVQTIGGSLEIEALRQVGDEKFLLTAMLRTSGTASGAGATWRIGQVLSIRAGIIGGLDSYCKPTKPSKP